MKKSDWILSVIILASFLVGVILYPNLPEQMPIHWNIHGEVDGYMSKNITIFLLPAISLAIFLLMVFIPKIDPRKENYQKFRRFYVIIQWAIVILFIIIYLITIMYSLKEEGNTPFYLQVSFIVPFLVSILLIIIGNYLGKIKNNFFVGIRTPWTLNNDTVWNKTHRLGGKLFVLSGLVGVLGSFIGGYVTFLLLLLPILISTITLIVYSYIIFKKENR